MRSLAPSSINIYEPWLRRYVLFAREWHLSLMLPTPAEDLQAFVGFLEEVHAKPGSISMALAAISALHASHNFLSPTLTSTILHKVSKAMITASKVTASPKTPAPAAFMHEVANFDPSQYPPADALRERLLLSMLFYGLMRPKEAMNIRVCQLEWHPTEGRYMFHPAVMKNYRAADAKPAWIYSRGPYSAGFWLQQWLELRGHYTGFHGRHCIHCPLLFSGGANTTPPSSTYLQETVSRWARWTGFSHLQLTPSSFRAGGATTMHNAGVALLTVQQAGLWKSGNMVKHYIRTDDQPQQEANTALGQAVAAAPPAMTDAWTGQHDERHVPSLKAQVRLPLKKRARTPRMPRTPRLTPPTSEGPESDSDFEAPRHPQNAHATSRRKAS
ncbi:MAG: tyrosine-type recombinase/integrase [Terriglobales bacterium]